MPGPIQDFGSTRLQLRVRDIDAAIAAFERFGGEIVSTGGQTLALPAGTATLQVAIVRDPNNLFVVLIEAPPGLMTAAYSPSALALQVYTVAIFAPGAIVGGAAFSRSIAKPAAAR